MIVEFSTFPNPFEVYSEERDISQDILEKLYRTGYLWRDYDIPELQDYLLILTKHQRQFDEETMKSFIRHSEAQEQILKLEMMGRTQVHLKELTDKNFIRQLVKQANK